MPEASHADVETDPRFPSGPWIGFFIQSHVLPGRHMTELRLTFRSGDLTGEGRDYVGSFTIRGRYSTSDGKCQWKKQYVGKHCVIYQGYNEGKGIWGTWDIPPELNLGFAARGGFHIWPEGMADPTAPELSEKADLPVHVEEVEELIPIGESSVRNLQLSICNCQFSILCKELPLQIAN